MPSPSNPSPRRPRAQSANPSRSTPPRAGSGRASKPRSTSRLDDRTLDLTEPRRASSSGAKSYPKNSNDPGLTRRAQKKKRARQNSLLAWTVAAGITIIIGGTAAGILSEYQRVQGRVSLKRATLADLKMELESGRKRLGALASAGGKERVLVENGYIKPGERLLLFPKGTPKKDSKNGG